MELIRNIFGLNESKSNYFNQADIDYVGSIAFRHLEKFKKEATFLNNFVEFESREFPVRLRYSDEWKKFLDHIAGSLLALYKYNTELVNYHPYFTGAKDKIEKYLACFYIDMVVSKAKHSFFTEFPHDSIKDLSNHRILEIYMTGMKLVDRLSINQMRTTLASFHYKIFLMYDFIYCRDKRYGVFTDFEKCPVKFNKGIKYFKQPAINNLEGLRTYCSDAISSVLKLQLSEEIVFNNDDPSSIFSVFVSNSKHKSYQVEPISYFLAFKIWKIGKLAQVKFKEIHDKHDNEILDNFLTYISNISELGTKLYNQKMVERDFLLKLYECDLSLAQMTYSYLHPKGNNITLRPLETECNRHINTKQSEASIDISNIVSGVAKLSKINNSEFQKWKFNRIFLTGNKDELLNIINALNSLAKVDNKNLVGLYKSGALLAHCLNVCNGKNKPVYLFTSFPYISLNPLSADLMHLTSNEFILVDESYKTGFTATVVSEYLKRNLRKNKPFCEVVALTQFMQFPQIEKRIPLTRLTYIENINDINSVKCDFDGKSRLSYDFQKMLEEITYTDMNELSKAIYEESIVHVRKNEIESDGARILARTDFLFSIAKHYVDFILNNNKLNNDDNVVYLASSNDEGKLLSETIALCSLLETDRIKFIFDPSDARELHNTINCRYFIDIGIDSATSVKQFLSNDYETENFEILDGLFSIFATDRAISNAEIAHKLVYIVKR